MKKEMSPLMGDPVILCPPKAAAALLDDGHSLVCIVRHGQTDWNVEMKLQGRECVPLNDHGRSQARRCAEMLASAADLGLRPSAIFTSPLSRAKETADIIAARLGLETVETEEMLIERNYGELSGLTLSERHARFPKGERQARGVESVAAAAVRMKKAMYRINRATRGKTVLAVTHGGTLNALFIKNTRGKIGTGKNISPNCGVSLMAVNMNVAIPLAYGLKGDAFLDYISGVYSGADPEGRHEPAETVQ